MAFATLSTHTTRTRTRHTSWWPVSQVHLHSQTPELASAAIYIGHMCWNLDSRGHASLRCTCAASLLLPRFYDLPSIFRFSGTILTYQGTYVDVRPHPFASRAHRGQTRISFIWCCRTLVGFSIVDFNNMTVSAVKGQRRTQISCHSIISFCSHPMFSTHKYLSPLINI